MAVYVYYLFFYVRISVFFPRAGIRVWWRLLRWCWKDRGEFSRTLLMQTILLAIQHVLQTIMFPCKRLKTVHFADCCIRIGAEYLDPIQVEMQLLAHYDRAARNTMLHSLRELGNNLIVQMGPGSILACGTAYAALVAFNIPGSIFMHPWFCGPLRY